jgi:hypothetical protein
MAVAMRDRWTDERMDDLKGSVDAGFRGMDDRFALVDERFSQLDQRFTKVDERFERLDARLDAEFGRLNAEFGRLNQRFDTLALNLILVIGSLSGVMIVGFVSLAVAAL